MILVGSVVGSGELIMTTKLGAQTGFVLLWFVLLSCVIKVVVQAELARHTISSGRTFLDVFNSLPGPRGKRPVWLTLEWLAVVVVSCLLALAGYTQRGSDRWKDLAESTRSLANIGLLAFPFVVPIGWAIAITFRSRRPTAVSTGSSDVARPELNWFMWLWMATVLIMFVNGGAILGAAGQTVQLAFPKVFDEGGSTIWGLVVACVAAALLLGGGYQLLEKISVGLVASFTLITIFCTILLQETGYAITPADIQNGLTFDLPTSLTAGIILTGLGMYAGTGIGTSEMTAYSYWCVEKGYARNAGAQQPGEEWPRRARGWVRVMYCDVFLTMLVYTASTICFYFLGAAVLHAKGLDPEGPETLAVLGNIYTSTLGSWAATLFIVGAFFVLFSTVLSAVAASSRVLADALCVMGIIDARDYAARICFTRVFVFFALGMYAITYSMFENPPVMLMITSIVSVVLYPVFGLGAIWFRYREVDPRITPGRNTTFWLWVCGLAIAIISPAAAFLALAIKAGWVTIGS
jgi:Mn2+/Fe2+ NRAMP family transporter